MSEFESFGVWICGHTSKLLIPAVEKGVSPPKSLGMTIFQVYSEIHTSHERLGQITRYVGRVPLGSLRVSKLDYLRLQLESYLQETYILKMRIKAFLNLLEKQPPLRRHKEIAKLRCLLSSVPTEHRTDLQWSRC
jgi:hypothetical protein